VHGLGQNPLDFREHTGGGLLQAGISGAAEQPDRNHDRLDLFAGEHQRWKIEPAA
jgi:hypothetical protein